MTSIFAIGRTADESLCGSLKSSFWVEEWGYPDIGIYLADCPSAGHDMIALDYRSPANQPSSTSTRGRLPNHQPRPNFAAFIAGLVDDSVYENEL